MQINSVTYLLTYLDFELAMALVCAISLCSIFYCFNVPSVRYSDNLYFTISGRKRRKIKEINMYSVNADSMICRLTVEEHMWIYARLKGMPATEISVEMDRLYT